MSKDARPRGTRWKETPRVQKKNCGWKHWSDLWAKLAKTTNSLQDVFLRSWFLQMRGHVTSHVILIDFVYFAKSFWWIKCSAPNFTDVLEATSELECSSFMAFNLHAVLTSPTSRCPYARPSFVTLGHFCVVISSLSSAIDVVSLHAFAAPSNLINTPRLKHLALDQSCTSSAEWSAWSQLSAAQSLSCNNTFISIPSIAWHKFLNHLTVFHMFPVSLLNQASQIVPGFSSAIFSVRNPRSRAPDATEASVRCCKRRSRGMHSESESSPLLGRNWNRVIRNKNTIVEKNDNTNSNTSKR